MISKKTVFKYLSRKNLLSEITKKILPFRFVKVLHTLESVIDVGQGISVWHGKFRKKNNRRAGKI